VVALSNEKHNADGKHVTYLDDPLKWRGRDPALFDALCSLVASGRRSVAAIEALDLIPGAQYFSTPISAAGSTAERRSTRSAWFKAALEWVAGCDLVFVDPDNGLETDRYDAGRVRAGKSVSLAELSALRQKGRAIVVYHHQTRMAGGHQHELLHWGHRLSQLGFSVDALRASAFSARAFFLLDASDELRTRAEMVARRWGDKL
jgi:hypothetical protein